jgi:cyclopropane fatty-acyl-phospholipid synthase-like methyltransferase
MHLNRFLYSKALAAARGCDFAHPGEAQAIDRLLMWLPVERSRSVLDLGCGLGGTANYLAERGWKNVVGVDPDPESVAHARARYPALKFETGTVDQLPDSYQGSFSTVLAINIFYLIADKDTLLGQMEPYLQPNARLVISDYLDRGGFAERPLLIDGERVIPHAETYQGMHATLERNSWELEVHVDLSTDYLRWYVAFTDQIQRRREAIVDVAGEVYYEYLSSKYQAYVETIRGGTLGGGITVAKWRPMC